jgi:hypothetical protein
MSVKVRIKAGPVEFEYEGETELGVADIKDLFSHIEKLFKVPVLAEGGDTHNTSIAPPKEHVAPSNKLHVNSVATNMRAKTGPELALAAAASLQIMEGKPTFTRQELLDVMKSATLHYKENMSGNLTSIIKSLVGPKFNQIGNGVYSLTADAHQQLATQLA